MINHSTAAPLRPMILRAHAASYPYPATPRDPARAAYEAWAENKTQPHWFDLPDARREIWRRVAAAVMEAIT